MMAGRSGSGVLTYGELSRLRRCLDNLFAVFEGVCEKQRA